jgi:hypothetical protein
MENIKMLKVSSNIREFIGNVVVILCVLCIIGIAIFAFGGFSTISIVGLWLSGITSILMFAIICFIE